MKTSRLFKKQKVLAMIRVLRVEINCGMKRTSLVAPGESVAEGWLLEDGVRFGALGCPHLPSLGGPQERIHVTSPFPAFRWQENASEHLKHVCEWF